MQEEQVENYSEIYGKFVVDYIQKSFTGINKIEARSIIYHGKHEVDSKGNILYFPDGHVARQYEPRIKGPKSVMFKYHGKLNMENDNALYETIIEFHVVNALQSTCPEILAIVPKRIVEYHLFLDKENDEIKIRHGIRMGKQLVFVLNQDYELEDLYFNNDFFKTYRDATLEELKTTVLFFTLCAYNNQMRLITQNVDIHDLNVDQMKQYITLVDMIQV